MSWKDCAAAVRAAAGRELTDDQVEEIFERAQARQKALTAAGTIDGLDERLRAAVAEDADRLRIEGALAKKHAALSVIARDRVTQQVERHIAAGLKPRAAVLALFEGTTRGIEGGRHSVAATKLAYEARYVGGMMAGVVREVPHAEGLLRDKAFLDDVVREMHELREGGAPGATGNTDARKVAKVFADNAERARLDLNRLGANIGKLDGWAGAQVHDADKIGRVAAEDWASAILPKLDVARTVPDLAEGRDVRKALGRIYENIVFERETGASPSPEAANFQGPRNVAKALERHRVLHFKSADDWLSYSEAFGHGHIFDGMVHHQSKAAMNASQMEILGPNPGGTLKSVLDGLRRRIDNDAAIAPADKLKAKAALTDDPGAAIGMAFRIASGASMMPVSRTISDVAGTIRAVQSLSKLGGAVVSSITDLPSAIVNLRFNGLSYGEAIGSQVTELFRGRGQGEQRHLAYLLGEGFDGVVGHITSGYVAGDSAPGAMQRAMSNLFRWTGLTKWTDANRAASARILSAHLGSEAGKAFDGLDPRLQNVLRQHDITPAAWDVARAEGVKQIDGRPYLIPEGFSDPKVELAMRRYFADEAASGVIEADPFTARLTTGGLSRGTAMGEAIRFVTQFKSFPIAFTQRVAGRAWQGGAGGSTAGAAHIGGLLAGLLAAGYASMTAKDALRGYTPRDPTKPKTILAALAQSGGAGIYGDFLFGEASRTGNAPLENAFGPTAADAARILGLYTKARDGDARGADALNSALSSVPFANTWFARPVLDYLVLNELRETLSPGYRARQDQRRRQDYGQDPLIAPSDRMALDLF